MVRAIGSARRPKSAPAQIKGFQDAGRFRMKKNEAKIKRTGVKRNAGAYSYSVSAKKRAAQRSDRGLSRARQRAKTPKRTRFGNAPTSSHRESMMCQGEIARRNVARIASVLSPARRTRT